MSHSQVPTPAPPSRNNNTASTNKDAIIGGVVGGIAALALIALLWFYLHRKQRQLRAKSTVYRSKNGSAFERYEDHVPAQELDASRRLNELGEDHIEIAAELPGVRVDSAS